MINPTPSHAWHGAVPSPGFDVGAALERLGGNETLLRELMSRFASEHSTSADHVDALVGAHKPAHAVAELHRLKGAARIVGAVGLADAAQRAEHLLMVGDAQGLPAFRAALEAACAQCAAIA